MAASASHLLLSLSYIALAAQSAAVVPAFVIGRRSNNINMVEGHSVHRIASRFRSKLVGRKFSASSPNGRFADGAAAIDGRVLSRMEAVGKNLFAFFGGGDGGGVAGRGGTAVEDDDVVVVHVHFGMSGAWALYDSLVDDEPEVKPTTRLRLEEVVAAAPASSTSGRGRGRKGAAGGATSRFVAHLSAMTVQHGGTDLYAAKKAGLGEDPLRADADPDLLYGKVVRSKKSIGQLLMDQAYFAGPGNIYRAEILFLAGVHPTTPGAALDRPSFDRVWSATVSLLRRGYDTGSILTVDASVDPGAAERGERRYIYNRSSCARCGSRVSSWDMGGRTCYACEGGGCQPKVAPTVGSVGGGAAGGTSTGSVETVAAKGKGQKEGAKADRRQHVPFISHCAPISYRRRLEQEGADGLTVAEIRSLISEMSGDDSALPRKSARKAVHVEALDNLLRDQDKLLRARTVVTSKKEKATVHVVSPSKPLPPPMVSAEDAAREKARSGENRAVEHVAELSGEQTISAIQSVTPSPKRRRATNAINAEGKGAIRRSRRKK